MSNSSLVQYKLISPNRYNGRNHKIDTISIHCVVGQCAIETLGWLFQDYDIEASSNYGIGYDGKIGMFVEEKDASWCTSSYSNDNRAITIEVASDTFHPYAINNAAYNSLIKLVADICERNDIKELKWEGDKSLIGQVDKQNMTVHRWFANKGCPGDYLFERHSQIAEEVNAIINKQPEPVRPAPAPSDDGIQEGDLVSIKAGATYYNGGTIPDWVRNQKWYVEEVAGNRAVINKSEDGVYAIMSPVHTKYLVDVNSKPAQPVEPAKPAFKSYTVKVTADALNIRKGPGTNYASIGMITNNGIYTIVDEATGAGATKWGKLKAGPIPGSSWIALDYTKKN